MIAAAHQPLFLPWIGYFHKINMADVFIISDNNQFTRSGWITRNKIKTSDGVKYLIVPVQNKRQSHTAINKVMISYDSEWKNQHLQTLERNYKRSRYFGEVFDFLYKVYMKDWIYLSDFDIELIQQICKYLDIRTKILLGSDLETTGRKTELIIDICRKAGADTFIVGMGGSKDYMDYNLLCTHNIKYLQQNFTHPVYHQNFGEFIPNLSILDLLFNCGKESICFLENDAHSLKII